MTALNPGDSAAAGLSDEEVAVSLGEPVPTLLDRLCEFITALEPIDLEAAITSIESEPLPAGDERRTAALNRADRAELMRGFLALRTTGRGIVRRLQDDAEGRARDE